MTFIQEIWARMGDNFIAALAPVFETGRRIGFKFKRGELKLPEDMVKGMLREAYIQGARDALKMAAHIDGEEG